MVLVLRGSIYYFRRRLPAEIADLSGVPEVCRSLKTRTRSIAFARASLLEAGLERLRYRVSTMSKRHLTRDLVTHMVETYRSLKLAEVEEFLVDPVFPLEDAEAIDEQHELVEAQLGDMADCMAYGDLSRPRKIADGLIEKNGAELDRSAFNYKLLCRQLLHVDMEAARITMDGLSGDYRGLWGSGGMGRSQGSVGGQAASPVTDAAMLRASVERYCTEKEALGDWTAKSAKETRQKLDVMVRFFGDVPVPSMLISVEK